jgi:hypothetical protein
MYEAEKKYAPLSWWRRKRGGCPSSLKWFFFVFCGGALGCLIFLSIPADLAAFYCSTRWEESLVLQQMSRGKCLRILGCNQLQTMAELLGGFCRDPTARSMTRERLQVGKAWSLFKNEVHFDLIISSSHFSQSREASTGCQYA